jgi:hypothetical protein
VKDAPGHRILARRLARDLEACIDADDRACFRKKPFILGRESDRRFSRAKRTLKRFQEYEGRQK